MSGYVLGRLAQALVVILGVTFVTFSLMYLSGDPVAVLAGENWSQAEVDAFRREMGFDRPWLVQYRDFAVRAAQGDFGRSLRYRQPVFPLILERIPQTMLLASAALCLSILVAVPLGVVAATRRGTVADTVTMLVALVGQSMPGFWLGILIILIFGVRLRWLPVSGTGTLWHLVMPALTLSAYSIARNARLVRSSLLDVLGRDYIRTARAKGLPEPRVVRRHALRNAMLAVTTIIGLELGFLLGGAVITETIFAWPGLGRLTIQAIYGKDLFLVQGAVMLMSVVFVLVNLAVDLLYSVLDPRVRYA
jgi:peptide/nickel transport system permease protein